MKLSLNWLQRYVNLSGKTTDQLEEALTLIGFEVEGIEHVGLPELSQVQVGEVVSFGKHPNADKLRLCQVRVQAGEEPTTIVCGASNFNTGDRVVVALPGARLPLKEGGVFKIKKSKIRGEESHGMMCSASELGLAESSEGILILEGKPEVGTPVNSVFTDSDTVFDIEVTPNRPDCLSHLGMARELAAYFDLGLTPPQSIEPLRSDDQPLVESVEVQTPVCPQYSAWSVRGVKIEPSPDWLQRALEAVGLRPINNVVDVTNFILLECGQPLHAFDAAKIRGKKLIVRQANEGETLTTLDGKERSLSERMCVIADAERPLVVAGVMGSIEAEVDETTTDIVLEAACFDPAAVRWTSRRLGLSTDSSYRFERGVDAHATAAAAYRCLQLILETAGGRVSGNPIQVGELPQLPAAIEVDPQFFINTCGFGPEPQVISSILQRLDLMVETSGSLWKVTPPSSRRDLERPVDLVEEFLRIYGTDTIPESDVLAHALHRKDAPLSVFNSLAANLLCFRQLNECVHYSLREGKEIEQWFGAECAEALKLTNPLASDQSHLRPSLLPGLLDAMRHNLSHGNAVHGFFETGRVFRKRPSDAGSLWELASVAFVQLQNSNTRQWKKREPADIFTAKSLILELLEQAGVKIKHPIFETLHGNSLWQERHAAHFGEFTAEGFEANLGMLNLHLLKAWDIDSPVVAGELVFAPSLFEKPSKRARFTPYGSQPASVRDLALLVDRWQPAESVRGDIDGFARKAVGEAFAVETVEIFDLYEGQALPEGKKSLALAFKFRAADRTLRDDEVNPVFEAIQAAIAENSSYTVRK